MTILAQLYVDDRGSGGPCVYSVPTRAPLPPAPGPAYPLPVPLASRPPRPGSRPRGHITEIDIADSSIFGRKPPRLAVSGNGL